ncbi:unnamed protein product [Didymodactylos carnosus]|uniref:Uncharacterized protein n=1 Tax=Didymodactylos carnosus TaxID=1234261 RepID=A0A814JMT9_9BILA|nr:unnamed protein product [Didymodactylos carnosus]CAF1039839.1 unnamed protein product [Didymodactylos carnosus]CAF3599769.1 unnamed protein product [Didymodactylos carnosus]CAF3810125.1 unnamed protein product [Didymodactylos carnosus]
MLDLTEAACGCNKWCRDHDSKWGKCGDGHTCLCSNGSQEDMTNGQSANGCGCNKWCQDQGHKSGKCGDGHTCICDERKNIPTLPAPPATWKEHWFEHRELLTRVYYDNDLALYYEKEVSRATIPKVSKFLGNAWRYVKRNYGSFGSDGRLYAIYHAKAIGGHPAYYYSSSHDNRNAIDVGMGSGLQQIEHPDMPTHEIFHIVEFAAFNIDGSPGFGNPPNGIWGDSKMAEIFIYDVYKGLSLHSDAKRFKNSVIGGTSNVPKPNTYWFRDWLLPWYTKGGGTKSLVNFFRLLSQNFPKHSGTNRYSRQMNWGEFIHFSSGAAGANMKNQAKIAFGWTNDMEKQFNKARSDFPNVKY